MDPEIVAKLDQVLGMVQDLAANNPPGTPIRQDSPYVPMIHAAIIGAKGATYYRIGAALLRIIRAIVRDENAILTVSSRVPESLQLGEVALSLPSIVNRHGIARVLPVALDDSEWQALEASVEVVKGNIATLSQTIPV